MLNFALAGRICGEMDAEQPILIHAIFLRYKITEYSEEQDFFK